MLQSFAALSPWAKGIAVTDRVASLPFLREGYRCDLARSEKFELPTLGFEVRCSIQLSYERVLRAP